MASPSLTAFTALLAFAVAPDGQALAVDGEVLITQARALQGNITPGDAAGFPVRITRPGKYKLAGDLRPPADVNGIVVTVSHVAIDFNGFHLLGGQVALNGVVAHRANLLIENGTISGFTLDGLTEGDNPSLWTVRNMQILANGRFGIRGPGADGVRIEESTVARNGNDGIICDDGCHIKGSLVFENRSIGVNINNGSVIGSTIIANTEQGVFSDGNSVGLGENTLLNNNSGGPQTTAEIPMDPNACIPACP